jgi:hypothetical protein
VEWSHLLDIIIWLLAAPPSLFIGWRHALLAAGVALGPLCVGLLGATLAFCAEPFVARRFMFLLPVAAATLPALQNYASPGIVTHHILLLALIALTAGYVIRAWHGEVFPAFLAGLAGGFAIWLTPETMPFILLCYAALGARWLDLRIGTALAACGAGCFDVLGFGFIIDPAQGGYWALETDRLSLVFATLGILLLIAGVCLWQIDRLVPARRRRVTGIAICAVLGLLWLGLFPKTLAGPYGLIDPVSTQLFFGSITEMQPAKLDATAVAYLLPGLLGAGIAAFCAARYRSWRWLYVAAAMLLALALGVKFIRFAPISAAAAAVIVTIAIQRLSAHFFARPALAAAARITLIFLLLVAPRLPAMALAARPAVATPAALSCNLRNIGVLLAPAAGKIILADVNATPEILWRSQALTVGSLYHHGIAGFLRLRSAWRSPAGSAEPAELRATGASYILFCSGGGRTNLVADLPKKTLWDALNVEVPPPWLTVIAADPATGWRLFQINPK